MTRLHPQMSLDGPAKASKLRPLAGLSAPMSATHGCVDIEGLDDRFHGHGGCGFLMGVSAASKGYRREAVPAGDSPLRSRYLHGLPAFGGGSNGSGSLQLVPGELLSFGGSL